MMNYLIAKAGTYVNNKKGQGMVEYALLLGLLAIGVIAILIVLGPQIAALFDSISKSIPAAA